MKAHVRERLAILAGRSAIPGYVLLALSVIGVWSNVEFAIIKIRTMWAYVPPWVLMVAGFGWLGWLILRSPRSVDRVEAMRRLLDEAAVVCLATPRPQRVNDDATRPAMRCGLSVREFLKMGFAHDIRPDFEAFMNREREIWKDAGQQFNPSAATARYLERLRSELSDEQLDHGFHLPNTFEQFLKADTWQPNVRPVPRTGRSSRMALQ